MRIHKNRGGSVVIVTERKKSETPERKTSSTSQKGMRKYLLSSGYEELPGLPKPGEEQR